MTENDNPLRRLQQSLALQDIYIRSANATTVGAFDPKEHDEAEFGVQLKFSVASSEYKPNKDDKTKPGLVRYLIGTGLRFTREEGSDSREDDSESKTVPVAEITATFVVDYLARDPSAVTKESLEAFNQNALHHVWPYWREFIHTSSGRLRLPSVILPIRQPLKRRERLQSPPATPQPT